MDRLIPSFNIPILNNLIVYYLNAGSTDSRPLLDDMLSKTDFDLMKWSMTQIYHSDRKKYAHLKLINILGTEDKIMRQWFNSTTYKIEGGSHFMVYEKADEVEYIINKVIKRSTATIIDGD